jgi:predicted DNA-binding transcriptional regulator AlpA
VSITYSRAVELLTVSDIARQYGVSRQAAHNWSRRDDFPTPLGTSGSGRVWKRAAVERWARKAGKETP